MADNKQVIALYLTKELVEKISEKAKKLGVNRSAYAQIVLQKSIEKEVI